MAGLTAVREGISVTIVEKGDRVGYPLNCGEGVARVSVDGILDIEPGWIRTRIHHGLLVSPSGHTYKLDLPNAGYILNRPAMQQGLADAFQAAGGTLMTGHRATGLQSGQEGFQGVVVESSDNPELPISAAVVVAADGVESTIARIAGIDNRLDPRTTESFLQYYVRKVSVVPDQIEVHVGSNVAVRSYLWIFPRGADEVGVGLGVAADSECSPKDLLNRFVAGRFPEGEVVGTSGGASPRYQGPDRLAEKNLLVVGDAARVLDSATGAGIANALLSGQMAGRAAAAWCRRTDRSLDRLHAVYPGEFTRQKHDQLQRYRRIKEFLDRLSDDDLDEIVLAVDRYFETKTVDSASPVAVLLQIISEKPRLLGLARHLF